MEDPDKNKMQFSVNLEIVAYRVLNFFHTQTSLHSFSFHSINRPSPCKVETENISIYKAINTRVYFTTKSESINLF